MNVRVRIANPDDRDIIVDYNRRLAQESEAKSLNVSVIESGVAKVLADPTKGIYFLAEDPETGSIVGQLMITLEWSDWRDGWFWWIQSVYVRSEWRGRGVLRALVEEAKRRAAGDSDVVGFRLYVEVENEAARRAYRALGMEETSYRFFEMITRPSS